MKTIIKIFYWLALSLLLIIAATVAASSLNIPGGVKLFTVQSGSMEPTIHTGSLIISKPFATYSKGEIVTFKSEGDRLNSNPKTTTTHRIYKVELVDNKLAFTTKGDANKGPDAGTIDQGLIIGKEVLSIPLLGYPISFAKTKEGLLILIIIPAVIIIYSELINIKNEAQKLIRERKRKLTMKEKVELEIGEQEIKVEKETKNLWNWIKKLFK